MEKGLFVGVVIDVLAIEKC